MTMTRYNKARFPYELPSRTCWPLPHGAAAGPAGGDWPLSRNHLRSATWRWQGMCRMRPPLAPCPWLSAATQGEASLALPVGIHVVLLGCYGILTNGPLA